MKKGVHAAKETPGNGRFFYAFSVLLSLALLGAGWLMPLHFPPWLSWHSEMLAFAAVLMQSSALLIRNHYVHGGRLVLIPRIGWPMGLLCVIAAIQLMTGRIEFKGDAVVLTFYLWLSVLALTIGYSFAVAKEQETTSTTHVGDQIAVLLVVGGLLSVIVALVQTLDIWESVSWVARPHMLRRPGGNLSQPNQLATLVLFSLASVIYLFESRRMRVVTALPIAAIFVLGLAITESRTGALGLLLMALWWMVKRRRVGFSLSGRALVFWLAFFVCCFVAWPTCFNFIQGGAEATVVAQVNTSVGTRLVVWPQLWQAVLMRPWFGWGLREVSTAHNAVLGAYTESEAFTYAHNIVLDLAVGVGLPLTFLLVGVTVVWLWRRLRAADDLLTWYCLAVALPFGVHSMLEYPFAYAYLLVPVMFLLGALEARTAPAWIVRIPWSAAVTVWMFVFAVMVWSVVEYIEIEEDFRIARFEAMRMGRTPSDYERPHIVLLTQLDALLDGARIIPASNMTSERIELARKVAMRFPWPATQNRYALSLALNGNPDEAIRQLKVMRAMHGEKTYEGIRANWEMLAQSKYPQLGTLKLP